MDENHTGIHQSTECMLELLQDSEICVILEIRDLQPQILILNFLKRIRKKPAKNILCFRVVGLDVFSRSSHVGLCVF